MTAAPAPERPSGPLLTLETLEPQRPFVTIDGKPYELAVATDFGLRDQARLARLLATTTSVMREVEALPPADPEELEAVPDQLAARVVASLDEMLELILRAPAEVKGRLSEPQKRAIVEVFSSTVLTTAAPSRTKRSRRSRSTSGSS
jgi:hypothetical protein